MSREPHKPEWFTIGDQIMGPIVGELDGALKSASQSDLNLKTACEVAGLHFVQCVDTSAEVNKSGMHAIAVSLVRQCLEALSVAEAGLQSEDLRDQLVRAWLDEKITAGGIRKRLEKEVWGDYGNGLWHETWSEFMSEFTQAVHPYAHYTQLLQGWQFAHLQQRISKEADGSLLTYMTFGPKTYDATKATRITMLHMILAWIAGRMLIASGHARGLQQDINALGRALAEAEWLGGGKAPWHQEFWPHMFDKPID